MSIGKENEAVEYKRSTGELKEAIISIASILNKHNQGEIYFGIRNDGTPVGQMINDETLRKVSQAIAYHIEPKIYPSIRQVVVGGCDCILVEFEGENVPYFAYNRAYIRVADEDRLMHPSDLERFILKKNAGKQLWDSLPSNQTIKYVSEEKLKRYIKKANLAGRIDFEYMNNEDAIKRLNMMDGENILNAAKVMFSNEPRIEVQMATFATDVKLTFIDIQRASGTILELVNIAEKYIKNTMRWRVVFDGSMERKEIPEVPIAAIREALINSYCHRLYDESQTNEVAIFRNRIEIYNPGTFPDGYTPEEFIEQSEPSIKRNPTLAQLLYYSKEIESFGTGLFRIKQACDDADVKFEFKLMKQGFKVIFYRKEPGQEEDYFGFDKPVERDELAKDTGQDTGQDKLIELLRFCEVARSREEMQSHISIASRGHFMKLYLKPLLESGKLKMTIPDKPSSRNQKYIKSK